MNRHFSLTSHEVQAGLCQYNGPCQRQGWDIPACQCSAKGYACVW